MKNQRPRSNLPFICKLIVNALTKRTKEHFAALNHLHAYCRSHSTEIVLLEVALITFILPAAFDTINHPLLLIRLEVSFSIENGAPSRRIS